MITNLRRLIEIIRSPKLSPFPIIMVKQRQCHVLITLLHFLTVYTKNYIFQVSPLELGRSGRSPGEGNGNPLQYSCLQNPMDGGTW